MWTQARGLFFISRQELVTGGAISTNYSSPEHYTLGGIGALQQRFLTENHLNRHLFTFPCLHAGAIHLVINLCIVIFIGWAVRIGLVHSVSAFVRTLVDTLLIRNSPVAGASRALYGLHRVMFAVVAPLFCFSVVSVVLSLLSYVGKFSNIGGFVYGLLVGLVPLFSPQLWKFSQGLFKYGIKDSNRLRLKQNVDRLAGYVVLVLQGVNVSQYCKRCQYIDCVPFKWWSCTDKVTSSEDWILAEPTDLQGNTAAKRLKSGNGSSAPTEKHVIKGAPPGGNQGEKPGSSWKVHL
nr:RHOMBOID-like protein 8 isoform X1 [Quercus suber]